MWSKWKPYEPYVGVWNDSWKDGSDSEGGGSTKGGRMMWKKAIANPELSSGTSGCWPLRFWDYLLCNITLQMLKNRVVFWLPYGALFLLLPSLCKIFFCCIIDIFHYCFIIWIAIPTFQLSCDHLLKSPAFPSNFKCHLYHLSNTHIDCSTFVLSIHFHCFVCP